MLLSNLLVFLLPVVLFCYFFIIGYPFVRFFLNASKQDAAYDDAIFSAPIFGFIIILLVVFSLNYTFSLPVHAFAVIANAVLLVTAIAIMIFKKDFPLFWRYKPYFLILLIALGLVGYPLMLYGFGWLGFANDDMTNYCLGALRFFNYGFTSPPDIKQILGGQDYSLLYWFLHVGVFTRAGSELLLAWFYGVFGLDPHKIFMPLSIASHLILIFTSGLLITTTLKKYFNKRICLLIVMAASANLTLGLMYQLIAQIAGMALLIFLVVNIFKMINLLTTKNNKITVIDKSFLLIGLNAVGLLVYYPEIFPFAVLSGILYFGKCLYSSRCCNLRALTVGLIFIIIIVGIILNHYVLFTYHSILNQAVGGASKGSANLFSYFFVPTGLPAIFGVAPVTGVGNIFIDSVLICVGVVLSIWVITASIKLAVFDDISSYVLFVMLFVAIVLYIKGSGFGLFKLVMYAQPFIWVIFVQSLFWLVSNASYAMGASVIVLIMQLAVQGGYVSYGKGSKAGAYAQLFNGSFLQIKDALQKIAFTLKEQKTNSIYLDTNNLPLLKIQLFYLRTIPTYDLSRSISHYSSFIRPYNTNLALLTSIISENNQRGDAISKAYEEKIFSFNDHGKLIKNTFYPNKFSEGKPLPDDVFIFSGPNFNIFNRSKFLPGQLFQVLSYHAASNYLIFINSFMGQDYYLAEPPQNISLNQLQMDYFYPSHTMAALGKYLLLRVVNPSSQAQLLLNITSTLNPQARTNLPAVCLIGETTNCIEPKGNGSERVLIPLPKPRIIDQVPYVLIAISQDALMYPPKRYGLLNLYGRNVNLDYRHITTFARNISLIDKNDQHLIEIPSVLTNFPQDLANPFLIYQGFYEDGWVGKESNVGLISTQGMQTLNVNFLLPGFDKNFQRTVKIMVDSKVVSQGLVSPGTYEWKLNLPWLKAGLHKVELSYSYSQQLSEKDKRIAAAKINYIGFSK